MAKQFVAGKLFTADMLHRKQLILICTRENIISTIRYSIFLTPAIVIILLDAIMDGVSLYLSDKYTTSVMPL